MPDAVIEATIDYGWPELQDNGNRCFTLDMGAIRAALCHDELDLRSFAGTRVVTTRDGLIVTVIR